jgi:hypothetical protein
MLLVEGGGGVEGNQEVRLRRSKVMLSERMVDPDCNSVRERYNWPEMYQGVAMMIMTTLTV